MGDPLHKTGNGLIIYPNPAKNELFIVGNEIIQSISVYDVTGRKVISEKSNPKLNQQVSVSGLERGIYFIEVEMTVGVKTVKKFVKE